LDIFSNRLPKFAASAPGHHDQRHIPAQAREFVDYQTEAETERILYLAGGLCGV